MVCHKFHLSSSDFEFLFVLYCPQFTINDKRWDSRYITDSYSFLAFCLNVDGFNMLSIRPTISSNGYIFASIRFLAKH
jgi:hypothetical protein